MKTWKVLLWAGGLLGIPTLAVSARAQAPAEQLPSSGVSAEQSGPSMDETIAFLHDIYKRQPAVPAYKCQYFSQEIMKVTVEQRAACRLQVTDNEFQHNFGDTAIGGISLDHRLFRTILALDSSDPLSVTVKGETGDEHTPTPYFQVHVKRSTATTYLLALPVLDNRPVLDLPKADFLDLHGYVVAVSATEVTFVAQDEERYRIPAQMPKVQVFRNGQGSSVNSAQVGDWVKFERSANVKSGLIYTTKHSATVNFQAASEHVLPEQFTDYALPPVADEETANRVAKALIHAMVLCHKDEKPSPF